ILRPLAGIVATILLASMLLAPGARAHVGETFGHLWNEHIKPKLATPGTINAGENPVDWTKLKGVPSGLADGRDQGVDQAVGASGGGPNPSTVLQFFAEPVTVTVTSASQRILVTSHNGFGAGSSGATFLDLNICHQRLFGPVTPVGDFILGNQAPPNTRVPMGLSKILQLPVGQYWVGLCGRGGSGWTNNDWGSTTALVFST
ncbi:MAG: hypothetical protein ABWY83_07050, partial [Actinomycetota bacterium]